MVVKFKDLKGKANKAGFPRMKFTPGINRFRIVSNVMPGYKYWMKTTSGQSVPMDCLAFDPELEEFTGAQKDWVQHYFPDKRSSWAYSCFVIDRTDNTVKLLDLKKKLLSQIIDASKKLGDPSDKETGWDIICDRESTGPQIFNVEYKLQFLELEKTPLSKEDLKLIKDVPNIDEYLVRATPEEQKAFLESSILGNPEDVDEEAARAVSDDIPA